MSSPKKNLSKKELLDEIEKAKQQNGGKLEKAELMHLLLKSNLTPEEMKKIAKDNGIKLTKDDMKLLTKMKNEKKKFDKENEAKKSKDQIKNEID